MKGESPNQSGLIQLQNAFDVCFKVYRWLFILSLVLFVFSGVHVVPEGKVAYVQRLGKWVDTPQVAGLHFSYPFFIDKVELFDTNGTYTFKVSNFIPSEYHDERTVSRKVLLTKDSDLIHTEWILTVKLTSPLKKYLFTNSSLIEGDVYFLEHIFNNSCIQKSITRSSQQILSNLEEYKNSISQSMNKSLKSIQSGYQVTRIDLIRIDFPAQVKESFEEVQKERAKKADEITKANTYSKKLLREIGATLNQKLGEAKTKAVVFMAKIKAEAGAMKTILNNYSPKVFDTILEYKLQTVLAKAFKDRSDQTFVVQKGSELRINLAEDSVIKKIKRLADKKKQLFLFEEKVKN